MRGWLVASVVAMAALMGAGQALAVAPGDLDPSFGSGGVASIVSGATNVPAIQSDGKVLIGADSLSVVRLNADGAPDASFGDDGTASLSSSPPAGFCAAVLVPPDGKILVAGQLGSEFAIARYLPDGMLDPSFGAGTDHPGYVVTDASSIVSAPNASGGEARSGILSIALQPDGSIVALGSATRLEDPSPVAPSPWLARYTSSGVLDTSFGSSGTGMVSVGPALGVQLAEAGDGTIDVVSSAAGVSESRYSSSGAYDGSGRGYASLPDDGSLSSTSVIATADGSLTVGAQVTPSYPFGSPVPPAVVGLVRFNADGAPDPAFGTGGVAVSSVPAAGPVFAAAASDGSIVVGSGTTLARFTSAGAIDARFGVGGEEALSPGDPEPGITGVAVTPDGGILAVGYEGYARHGWVARYLAAGTPRSYHATVSLGGTGRGTVSDAVAGISCGPTCTGSIAPDSATTFTESPAAGSTFSGWSVPACGTQTMCTVTSQPGNDQVTVTAQFRRLAPQAIHGPTIAGVRRVGDQLSVRRGTWVGDGVTYRYQWQRCVPRCRRVRHATYATYRLGTDDRDQRLRVTVTATNPAGHVTRMSAEAGPIAAGVGELRTLLRRVLAHHPSLDILVRAHGYRYTIRTLGAGTITITWRSGRNQIGMVTVRFARPRKVTLRLTLTRAGRSLLARDQTLRITATARYTPRSASPISRTIRLSLPR